MAKYNKQFEYKGYKFNTSVELNTKAERKLDGKVWHTIITNCMGGNNYYKKEEVLSTELINSLDKHYYDALTYIDKLTNKELSEDEKMLSSLGFNKDI